MSVDRPRIDDALDALIENAIKATVPGQRIVLRALVRDGVAVLQVADEGTGVPTADRERIFERWGRSRTASTASRNGTGLGLPLARSIARAHGGTAELVDAASGPTTFELRLGRVEPTVFKGLHASLHDKQLNDRHDNRVNDRQSRTPTPVGSVGRIAASSGAGS